VLAADLSGGNKRKLSFAIAMLASPQVTAACLPRDVRNDTSGPLIECFGASVSVEH
jgi:hypothetical protein